jgi:amino acid transporter
MSQSAQGILVRALRRWDLVAFAINCIVGAGIFGLPSKLFAIAGTYSLLSFLVAPVVVLVIILCFAEVSSRFTETGGPYLYARLAFGPLVGFEVGWLMWLARLTAFAAICNLFVTYLGYFWPLASAGLLRGVIIAVVILLFTVINIVGVREASIVSNMFTIGKLLPIFLFVGAGLFFIDRHSFSFNTPPSFNNFSTGVLQLIFALSGFEMTVIPAGIGTLPDLSHSERPLADASSHFIGAAGATIISIGALISISGTLNAIMLAGPRLLFAMAEHRQLPEIFSLTHRRFKTPYVSILVTGLVLLILTISGTFIYALTISVMIRLITYAVTCSTLPVLRRKRDLQPATFRVPGGIAVTTVAILLCIWLISSSGWREVRDTALATAAGLPLYFIQKKRRSP